MLRHHLNINILLFYVYEYNMYFLIMQNEMHFWYLMVDNRCSFT